MSKIIIFCYFYTFILFNLNNFTSAITFNINNDNTNNKYKSQTEEDYLNKNNSNFNNSDFINYELPPSPSIYSLPVKIVLSTLATATSLVTIGGNLLVMCSFFLDRQIRNPTNYFLLSLSVSDFLIGLFSMPLYTLYLMLGVWPFGEVVCNLWLSLDYTVCLTSIYTVLFITIDRFCSVKIPAKYRKWRTRRKVIAMITCTWVIPISLFFTSIFAWTYSSPKKPFDPSNCDVGWSDDKWFNIILVISYFWTTLIVMIILYIFIYQVASNLERKSREKQRKLSSLVGYATTNTANALVAVGVAGKLNLNNANLKNKSIQNESHDDNYESDIQSTDIKNHKTKNSKINKSKLNNENSTIYNKSTKNNKNNENLKILNSSNSNKIIEDSGIDVDKHYLDKDSTQNNDGSSSFESHSDYDSYSKKEKFNKIAINNNKCLKGPLKQDTSIKSQRLMANYTTTSLAALLPRPEKLATMSIDSFAEKYANKQITPTNNSDNNNSDTNKLPETIPFIDEEYDELSYVLHKRQVDKDANLVVKEETIVIKSPFKNSFMQKLQSPLKNLSRKTSKSKLMNNHDNDNNSKSNNSNEDKIDKTGPIINKIEKTKLANRNTSLTHSISSPNTNSDSNTDSNINIYINNNNNNNNKNNNKDIKNFDEDIILKNKNNKKKHSSHDYDSEDYETTANRSRTIRINSNTSNKDLNKPTLLDKLKQKNNIKTAINNNNNNNNNRLAISLECAENEQIERNKRKLKHENRARKALRTITFILGAFVFCFAPWHVVSVWNSFCDKCLTNHLYLTHMFNICYWLCYLNSPINPFMYALANQQFRKTFLRILKRDWRRL